MNELSGLYQERTEGVSKGLQKSVQLYEEAIER